MKRTRIQPRTPIAASEAWLSSFAIAVALFLPQFALAQAFSATVTIQRNFDLAPNAVPSILRADCPASFVAVGGGVDLINSGAVQIVGSYPLIGGLVLGLVRDGPAAAPTGWGVTALNGGNSSLLVTVTAICSAVTGVSSVVNSVTVPAQSPSGAVRTDCPAGQVALAGGTEAALGMQVTTSAPVFAGDTFLVDQLPGTNAAPVGWSASTTARTVNAETRLRVAVTCANTSTVLSVVRAVRAVNPSTASNESIVCPAGFLAVGGGVDTTDRDRVVTLANSPMYNAYGYAPERASGTYAAPAGWFAQVGNPGTAPKNMVVAVVCARSASVAEGSIATVYEFYNTNLVHYFRTSSATEAAAIVNGSAGPGWVRTGDNFAAYTPGANATGSDVCRFYTFGANSHFYTAFAAECAGLKAPTSGWVYEGLSFRIGLPTTPTAAGCLTPLVPVYRLYNDRFAFNDSNHRFTTILAEVTRLTGLGWKNEGVAFCALNFSSG